MIKAALTLLIEFLLLYSWRTGSCCQNAAYMHDRPCIHLKSNGRGVGRFSVSTPVCTCVQCGSSKTIKQASVAKAHRASHNSSRRSHSFWHTIDDSGAGLVHAEMQLRVPRHSHALDKKTPCRSSDHRGCRPGIRGIQCSKHPEQDLM